MSTPLKLINSTEQFHTTVFEQLLKDSTVVNKRVANQKTAQQSDNNNANRKTHHSEKQNNNAKHTTAKRNNKHHNAAGNKITNRNITTANRTKYSKPKNTTAQRTTAQHMEIINTHVFLNGKIIQIHCEKIVLRSASGQISNNINKYTQIRHQICEIDAESLFEKVMQKHIT